jgi:hypothetical protein
LARLPDNFDAEDFTPPPLDPILAYRGVHVLCTTDKTGRVLKARYYCSCLVMGRNPIWGMWLVGGRFLRFYGSRQEIEADYSRLVWRRKMARFTLESLRNHSLAQRKEQLRDEYKKPLPKQESAA